MILYVIIEIEEMKEQQTQELSEFHDCPFKRTTDTKNRVYL